jgi:hypothetical protein
MHIMIITRIRIAKQPICIPFPRAFGVAGADSDYA